MIPFLIEYKNKHKRTSFKNLSKRSLGNLVYIEGHFESEKYFYNLKKDLQKIQMSLNKNWNENCYIFSEDGVKHIAKDTPNDKFKYIVTRAKLGFHAVVHGNRTVCEDLWEVERFTDSAINIQQDHASQTGNAVRDRYKGKDDFFEERAKMLQWTADYIDKEIKVYKKFTHY